MQLDFRHAMLGERGARVCRLGLAATYRPGKAVVHRALDAGINYFFCYGIDAQAIAVLRDLPRSDRERLAIATGGYNLVWTRQDFRRTLEKRLRQLRTDYLDVFLFLGVMKPEHFEGEARETLAALRGDARVRAIGISCHDRAYAGRLAREGAVDALMIRYNAAHRRAEGDIFPHLALRQPALISYTATRWRALLRRPSGWPRGGPVPTAAQCYRFVLSNPHVDVCMMAPSNARQLAENLGALAQGPLDADEMEFLRSFGDAVHAQGKWFM